MRGEQRSPIHDSSNGPGNETSLICQKGKDGASLREFWKEIKKQKVKIKAVAIDMSPAYIKSVTDHIGYDKIVFDWFHIKKENKF
ncbi:MAG: transposase [Saprospiraceae bacterium]|nr:transposase [Saprospiraceae bacterium]